MVRPARAKSATPEDPHARKPVAAMSKMAAALASVAGAFQSWVCKVSDDADSKEGVLLADAQAPRPHHDPPCRAHPCIPRLPVSQFAFVGFCRARGLTPSKLQVEQAFKKWATESGHTLSTSQDVDGAKVWKSRKEVSEVEVSEVEAHVRRRAALHLPSAPLRGPYHPAGRR